MFDSIETSLYIFYDQFILHSIKLDMTCPKLKEKNLACDITKMTLSLLSSSIL